MFNWSTDTAELKKKPQEYKKWRLEQLINFGLNTEKLNTSDLQRFLPEIHVDPAKKKYLSFLLSHS